MARIRTGSGRVFRLPTLAGLLLMAAAQTAVAVPIVITDTGDIADGFEDFRQLLGGANNGNGRGPIADGHRQINWDAGVVPFDMPGDFFNRVVPRGAEITTGGTGFAVSNPVATDPGAPDNRFDSINPTYGDEFQTFSAERLFTPVGSNVFDIGFFVPGSNTPATVSGFGAAFTDVDLADTTMIEFFNAANDLLLREFVDPDPQGLSFLGAAFSEQDLFRVRVTAGTVALGPDDNPGAGVDVVALDDFLYGEPQASVPEPSTLALLLPAVAGLVMVGRRRRKST
ncbi:MAG: PEP-CTERM sorting domain-containing protein [Gammaproteobacteria bacterium]|nr:PEP-CTERM sorting domain-containing protein [Gammaproteobacteria bacterium]